jgi:hypothetical protein
MDATSNAPPVTASHANSVRKALFALLRLAIGVGILVYLVRSGRVDLHSLTRVFRAWPLTLLGMGVLLIDILFMSIRVSLLFHAQRLSLSLWNAIQLTLVGFFFSTFLPVPQAAILLSFTTPLAKMKVAARRSPRFCCSTASSGCSLWC